MDEVRARHSPRPARLPVDDLPGATQGRRYLRHRRCSRRAHDHFGRHSFNRLSRSSQPPVSLGLRPPCLTHRLWRSSLGGRIHPRRVADHQRYAARVVQDSPSRLLVALPLPTARASHPPVPHCQLRLRAKAGDDAPQCLDGARHARAPERKMGHRPRLPRPDGMRSASDFRALWVTIADLFTG
jgi:hypothetical protein